MKRGPFESRVSYFSRWWCAALFGAVLSACVGPGSSVAPPPGPHDPQTTPRQAWAAEGDEGTVLAYDTFGQAQAGAPAILYLHGWCEHRGFWRPTASALQEEWFAVTVDLPGYGASQTTEKDQDPVAWAAHLASFARSLHDGPWVVVGHSLGGVVALETARALQETGHASGAVVVHGLYDPSRKFDQELNRAFANSLRQDYSGQMKAFVDALVPERTTGALSNWVLAQMQATDPAVAVAGLAALETYDLPKCLKALKVPVRAINARMRTTNATANRRLIKNFDVFILDSIEGPGLDLMLQNPTGFRTLLRRALGEMQTANH